MEWWQNKTRLRLEKAVYQRMIIRDVNNYIAIYEDGSLKRYLLVIVSILQFLTTSHIASTLITDHL
jgi:hypothetical protein